MKHLRTKKEPQTLIEPLFGKPYICLFAQIRNH